MAQPEGCIVPSQELPTIAPKAHAPRSPIRGNVRVATTSETFVSALCQREEYPRTDQERHSPRELGRRAKLSMLALSGFGYDLPNQSKATTSRLERCAGLLRFGQICWA